MKRAADPQQEELALSAVRAHALFPGRTMLYVREVAKALAITEQQVIDLINEHRDTGGASGLAAVDIASGLQSAAHRAGNRTARNHWRIPVSAFDAFVTARKTTAR